jgi:hypothetical protein
VTTAWHKIGLRPRPALHLLNIITTQEQNDRWKRLLHKHSARRSHKHALYRNPTLSLTIQITICSSIHSISIHASPHFTLLTPKRDFPPRSTPLRRSGTSRPRRRAAAPPRRDRGSRGPTGQDASGDVRQLQSTASRLRSFSATERIAGVFALSERYVWLSRSPQAHPTRLSGRYSLRRQKPLVILKASRQ